MALEVSEAPGPQKTTIRISWDAACAHTAGSGEMGTCALADILRQTALTMSRTLARCVWGKWMPHVGTTGVPPTLRDTPARWTRRRTSDR